LNRIPGGRNEARSVVDEGLGTVDSAVAGVVDGHADPATESVVGIGDLLGDCAGSRAVDDIRLQISVAPHVSMARFEVTEGVACDTVTPAVSDA